MSQDVASCPVGSNTAPGGEPNSRRPAQLWSSLQLSDLHYNQYQKIVPGNTNPLRYTSFFVFSDSFNQWFSLLRIRLILARVFLSRQCRRQAAVAWGCVLLSMRCSHSEVVESWNVMLEETSRGHLTAAF